MSRAATDAAVGGDRQFVTALARGLELLRCFTPQRRLLGTSELAALTGLPQPTVWRLAHTLVQLRYLIVDPASRRLSVGPAALSLGYAAATSSGIAEYALPLMQDISARFDVTASLGANDGLGMVIVQRAESHSALRLSLHVGSSVSLWNSALGAAFLAALPQQRRATLLDSIRRTQPDAWRRYRPYLESSLAQCRRTGYVLNIAIIHPEVNAIGVPISSPDGSRVMAMACGGPRAIVGRERLVESVAPAAVELARQLGPLLATGGG